MTLRPLAAALALGLSLAPDRGEATDAEAHLTEVCTDISELAAVIMQARQIGIPAAELLDTSDLPQGSPEALKAHRALVILAYSQPRYATRQYQIRAVEEFHNQIFIRCIGG